MANSFTNILDKILASGLLALRKTCVMPRLVNNSFSTDAAEFGDTIDVPIPRPQAAAVVTPSNTPPAPASKTPGKVQIALDQHYKTEFHLTDKQIHEIDRNRHFMPMQVSEAAKSLAEQVNSHIFSKFAGIGGAIAPPGSGRPFSSTANAATTIGSLIKIMGDNMVPMSDRRIVLDPQNEGDAVVLDWFRAADQSGTDETIRDASIGRRFGFDWFMDQQGGNAFTPGTGAGYLVNETAGYVAGDRSITVDTGSGTILAGDVVTFANHPNQYVVSGALATNVFTLAERGLKAAVPNDTAITVVDASGGARTDILAFHRDCIGFATRPLAVSNALGGLGNEIRSMQDPVSGLVLRLEVSRQYKQYVWEFDILWGSNVVIPEYGVRIGY